ncbi:MAG: RAMP superfamily CRISPR-associated protein, partial [Thiohalorhabdaceae bacterium]
PEYLADPDTEDVVVDQSASALEAALDRLARDGERLGIELGEWRAPAPSDDEAVVAAEAGDLFLEELRFRTRAEDLGAVVGALGALAGADSAGELEAQLAVVSDDRFAYLVRHATPVSAHVRIESDTKTVAPGALWYEETLPPETVLYAPLSAAPARKPAEGGEGNGPAMPAPPILGAVTDTLFAARP